MNNRSQKRKLCVKIQFIKMYQHVKKSNGLTKDEVHKKKQKLDTMRVKHNEMNVKVTYEGHQNWHKAC